MIKTWSASCGDFFVEAVSFFDFMVRRRQGVNTDFEAIFEDHKDAVFRFAWRMMHSLAAAEDIAQEVFLALLREPGRFDAERGQLRPFLLGIARNLILKQWRDERGWEVFDDERFTAEAVGTESGEAADIVARAVQSLPPLQREVLILAEYEELSLKEIALAVGSEVGTVKARLHRARENLRRMLAPLKPTNRVRLSHGTAG
jgi:RNA polymerase sigma-70 factor (ECF subfamily)